MVGGAGAVTSSVRGVTSLYGVSRCGLIEVEVTVACTGILLAVYEPSAVTPVIDLIMTAFICITHFGEPPFLGN